MTCGMHDMWIHAGIQAQSPSLVVISLPAVLFQTNGGVHNITAGSVIQLYCSVQSTTTFFSWTKDGRPVVIDVPHLRERRCNDSTSAQSVLTVDNFQSSDDGVYRCTAMDGNTTGQGGSIEMRGIIVHSYNNNMMMHACIHVQYMSLYDYYVVCCMVQIIS